MTDKKETPTEDVHESFYNLANQNGRSMLSLIDTMTQRGAIKGEELTIVGSLRDNVVRMIKEVEIYHSTND